MMKGDNKEKVEEMPLEREDDGSQEKPRGITAVKPKKKWFLRACFLLFFIIVLSAVAVIHYWPIWRDDIFASLGGNQPQSIKDDERTTSKEGVKRIDRKESAKQSPTDRMDISDSAFKESPDAAQKYSKIDQLNLNVLDTAARVSVLERRVDGLTSLLSKKQSQNTIDKSRDMIETGDKFENLRKRISLIEEQIATSHGIQVLETSVKNNTDKNYSLEGQINILHDRLTSKTSTFVFGENRATLLIFSVSQLANAVSTSEPFAIHLKAIEMVSKENPKIMRVVKDLRPYADKGVETIKSLKTRFLAMGMEIAKPLPEKDSLLSEIEYQLKTLVKVRKVQGLDINSFEGILLDAENAIKENDLKVAVSRLSSLSKHKIAQLDVWLSIANARLRIDGLVKNLKATALATLPKDD